MPCREDDLVMVELPENREKFVAEKLAKIIEVMADLTDVERVRIIKTSQAYYGAWGKDTPWGKSSRGKG